MPTYQDKYCKSHGITKQRLVKYKEGSRFRCQKCVVYKGGRCFNCGYDKCLAALDFHHLDPSEKEFSFSKSRPKWETLKIELDKCILLCANCHREVHSNG